MKIRLHDILVSFDTYNVDLLRSVFDLKLLTNNLLYSSLLFLFNNNNNNNTNFYSAYLSLF